MAERPLDGQRGDEARRRHSRRPSAAIRRSTAPGDAPPEAPGWPERATAGTCSRCSRPHRARRSSASPPSCARSCPSTSSSWAAARKHYGWHLKRGRHHSLYHLVRLPSRAVSTVRWAALGRVENRHG